MVGTTCDQGDVRLVGGSSQYEGTVEVCVDGKFSVVCDNSWDDKEAMVVCGQLSYATIGKLTSIIRKIILLIA